ncbi:hypothetical protein GGR56DRAFT_100154 [Xylariaceae sp. FL0804]|nr:hypothetical protein GGR56DRAFT_100154 [Xylariaceae sp. FL0804]
MASTRSAYDARGRAGDRSHSRTPDTLINTPRGHLPQPSMPRTGRREADTSRPGPSAPAQTRAQPSRIPQNPSSRRPSGSSTSAGPPLSHETQSWSTPPPRGQDDAARRPRNVLRRKQSTLAQEPTSRRNGSRPGSGRTASSSSIPKSQASGDSTAIYTDRSMTASPVEIRVAQQVELPKPATQPARIYPELDRYRDIRPPQSRDGSEGGIHLRVATDLPPPTPQFSGASSHSQLSNFSGSPSTRFSGSPGFGPYSRDTTPTSISSQSPGLVAPLRLNVARAKQVSPAVTRPPISRRRTGSTSNETGPSSLDAGGLAAVREALTSSSSGSTVRTLDKKEEKRHRGRALAVPNPPPRKSSQKFKPGGEVEASPSKSSRTPAQNVMRSPSPIRTRVSHDRARDVASPPQPRPTPPSRPSRDGTPDLYSQFGGPLPVIQSNLSSTSLTDRRQSGVLAPHSLPRSTTPSSSHDGAGHVRGPLSREPTPAPRPAIQVNTQIAKPDSGRTTRTPSPAVSFKSKFPLFGRRTKTAPEVPPTDKKKERSTRKGPAAGTGHEGYGRIGAVKRRSSITPGLQRSLPGPVSSSESLATSGSADPFLLERMHPVIIAGGEVKENRNASFDLARTESNQSFASSRPAVESAGTASSTSLASREESRQTLWPSALPRNTVNSRRPSDSSDSEALTMKSTLAFRRSIRGLNSQNHAPVSLPKPINTRAPSAASMSTAIMTDDSLPDIQMEPTHPRPTASSAPKKLTKRARSPRKWNIFGRSQAAKGGKKQVDVDDSSVIKHDQSETVAFYTLMDSPDNEDADQDVGALLREAKVLNDRPRVAPEQPRELLVTTGPNIGASQPQSPLSRRAYPKQGGVSTLQAPTAAVSEKEKKVTEPTGTTRPSRLPQVGRIPKVVNTRPGQTSPQSFSRPFNRFSLQPPAPEMGDLDQDSVAKGPSPPKSVSPDLAAGPSTREQGIRISLDAAGLKMDEVSPEIDRPGKEFLAFPTPKGSEFTTSTESSSSLMAGFRNQTAVVPPSTAPLGEDEVWDEYNDLLEDAPPSPTSSRGVPFHLETYQSRLARRSTKPPESPTIASRPAKRDDLHISADAPNTATTLSSHYSADMTARINAAFKFDSDLPATPFSVSEFVSGYEDRDSGNTPRRKETATAVRDSSSSNRSTKTKASSSRGSGSSRLSEETPLSQVNLRVGSMTVSKWLTFGHVLFSPVREELINVVGSLKRHSILVIDGLGNDDWSFYSAETYPAATFFNLSPRAPFPKDQQSSTSFPLAPPNHHQIQFTSYANKFPFGPESFTAVVFRFPSAAPEAHYRNIINEARRVLKPGGYIELSILDVDLNNVGSRTRRTARRLKERVSTQNPSFYLSSTADLMLRLLGKKGFTDIKSCRVGVPVASSIANSSAKGAKKDERSLTEMMNDKTEMGDENIAKMVSKVGRWWYNRCYEVPTGMKKSIWSDGSLLTECEEWGTSLKFMVCHARMPERGRVASI